MEQLTKLGSKKTEYKFQDPNKDMIETFDNPQQKENYQIEFTTDEFTSLCPKTGQPDFASIRLTYIPADKCIETKSLKMYLFAFRNYEGFMERIANKIVDDFVRAVDPKFIHLEMLFTPRGGITPQLNVKRGDPNAGYSIGSGGFLPEPGER